MPRNDGDGLLSRWSRRKAESRAGPRRGGAAPVATEEASPPAEEVLTPPLEEAPAAELPAVSDGDGAEQQVDAIAPEDLPDIDTLTAESDFTPFLQKGVPEDLARAALRKLWLSNTVFANLDGLNDYDENFRQIDRLISAADTNYQIGKGFLGDDQDDMESIASAETEAPAAEDGTNDSDAPADAGSTPASDAPADDDLSVEDNDSELGSV